MARTYLHEGETLDLVAPSGGVTSGTALLIGVLVVIPTTTAAAGAVFSGSIAGAHTITKVGSQAWTALAKVYWDDTNKNFTTTASGNIFAGYAIEAVGSGAGETTGKVLLNGLPA